jgi:hypothetical protein
VCSAHRSPEPRAESKAALTETIAAAPDAGASAGGVEGCWSIARSRHGRRAEEHALDLAPIGVAVRELGEGLDLGEEQLVGGLEPACIGRAGWNLDLCHLTLGDILKAIGLLERSLASEEKLGRLDGRGVVRPEAGGFGGPAV